MSVLKNLSMTSGVFLVVFVLSLVSAQNELELSPQSDLESIEEIQELLRNVQLIFETKIASKVREGTAPDDEDEEEDETDVTVDPNGCSCQGVKCSCCKHIKASKLKLNGNACLSVTYLRRNYGILVKLNYGGRTLFSKEVSARNPPPICAGIPFLKRGGSVCIQFYSLNVGKKSLSGCSRLLGRLLFVTVLKINVGCFHIKGLNATEQVGEVELPYFDVPQVEGPEPIYPGEVEMEKIKPIRFKQN